MNNRALLLLCLLSGWCTGVLGGFLTDSVRGKFDKINKAMNGSWNPNADLEAGYGVSVIDPYKWPYCEASLDEFCHFLESNFSGENKQNLIPHLIKLCEYNLEAQEAFKNTNKVLVKEKIKILLAMIFQEVSDAHWSHSKLNECIKSFDGQALPVAAEEFEVFKSTMANKYLELHADNLTKLASQRQALKENKQPHNKTFAQALWEGWTNKKKPDTEAIADNGRSNGNAVANGVPDAASTVSKKFQDARESLMQGLVPGALLSNRARVQNGNGSTPFFGLTPLIRVTSNSPVTVVSPAAQTAASSNDSNGAVASLPAVEDVDLPKDASLLSSASHVNDLANRLNDTNVRKVAEEIIVDSEDDVEIDREAHKENDSDRSKTIPVIPLDGYLSDSEDSSNSADDVKPLRASQISAQGHLRGNSGNSEKVLPGDESDEEKKSTVDDELDGSNDNDANKEILNSALDSVRTFSKDSLRKTRSKMREGIVPVLNNVRTFSRDSLKKTKSKMREGIVPVLNNVRTFSRDSLRQTRPQIREDIIPVLDSIRAFSKDSLKKPKPLISPIDLSAKPKTPIDESLYAPFKKKQKLPEPVPGRKGIGIIKPLVGLAAVGSIMWLYNHYYGENSILRNNTKISVA